MFVCEGCNRPIRAGGIRHRDGKPFHKDKQYCKGPILNLKIKIKDLEDKLESEQRRTLRYKEMLYKKQKD